MSPLRGARWLICHIYAKTQPHRNRPISVTHADKRRKADVICGLVNLVNTLYKKDYFLMFFHIP